ncbi:hypothetical protein LXL04_021223 [Taraxacum kok-saghyz]
MVTAVGWRCDYGLFDRLRERQEEAVPKVPMHYTTFIEIPKGPPNYAVRDQMSSANNNERGGWYGFGGCWWMDVDTWERRTIRAINPEANKLPKSRSRSYLEFKQNLYLERFHKTLPIPYEKKVIDEDKKQGYRLRDLPKSKHLQSADHVCKALQKKRWPKRLQSAAKRLFRPFSFLVTEREDKAEPCFLLCILQQKTNPHKENTNVKALRSFDHRRQRVKRRRRLNTTVMSDLKAGEAALMVFRSKTRHRQ